ncbi:MAG: H-type lectin domain-containing protein, partial [Magnetococcales bacterium]|nr:H-type lectin domain-containing protein [Magnetococcales bacterium]
ETLESRPKVVESRLESGAVVARQEDKGWRIANLFQREREFRERVPFEKGFARPPRVVLGVVGMEPGQERLHFQLSVEGVDATGFTLLVMTRAEERPRELRVSWSAFGE